MQRECWIKANSDHPIGLREVRTLSFWLNLGGLVDHRLLSATLRSSISVLGNVGSPLAADGPTTTEPVMKRTNEFFSLGNRVEHRLFPSDLTHAPLRQEYSTTILNVKVPAVIGGSKPDLHWVP